VRVLVTGGAGFIGSHIVDVLVDGAHDVVVLDNLHPAAHREKPNYLNDGADYRWANVCDPDAVEAALAGVDAVCHQAAMVGLGVDFGDATTYVRDNDLGTATLLTALHAHGIARRIVIASSMVVYGEGRYRCDQHGVVSPPARTQAALDAGRFDPVCPHCGETLRAESVPEDAPADPRNVYAATKLQQEYLGALFAREHPGTTVTALRYHNVYGPRMPRDTPYAGVASIFRSAIERGAPPTVLEDGQQRRDFVHVCDIARANVMALTTPEAVPGPLNIASGEPHTVYEMAHALSAATQNAKLEPVVVGGGRLGDVRHVFAGTARARERLGFCADVPFAEGMAEFGQAPLR
jgi:dTDP-L-rhamnose 4-epimerase